MGTSKKLATVRVNLAASRMNDKERADAMSVVAAQAPTSPLYLQHLAVKAAVDSAVQSGTDLSKSVAAVVAARGVLTMAEEALVLSRGKYIQAAGVLRTTVEATNPTAADMATLGLTGTIGVTPPGPLVPPSGIEVHLGRTRGQFRVVAVADDRAKLSAQASADPIGPATWVELPGTGKRRTVTGHASGSLVWVRFRVVRGETTSDWCTPVPVTVP